MQTYQKNQEIELSITAMGNDGEGIGKIDGYPFFVKDAIAGDVIRAKVMKANRNYAYARMMEILIPSPDRIAARCPIARQCGGCQIQEMSYEAQLRFKQDKVKNNIIRIGKQQERTKENPKGFKLLPIIGMDSPFGYRNKAQFPVAKDPKTGETKIGYYAGRTHTIMETEHCYLGSPLNDSIVNIIREYMVLYGVKPYDEETNTGCIRHILVRVGFKTQEVMVCLVIRDNALPKQEKLVVRLLDVPGMTSISYNVNPDKTNVIMGDETVAIYGEGYIHDYIGDVRFRISPRSFYQVNPVQTEKLYEKALEATGLKGKGIVWDLYCGIGTISLFLAKKAKKVYGVEIVPEAIEDARRNAAINGIENAEFFVGKAEEVLPKWYEEHAGSAGARPDVIVVDPPRKGCDGELLETVLQMRPRRVVYVSCDSATLARDVKILCDGGYQLRMVQLVDMFPMTGHVETVALLVR